MRCGSGHDVRTVRDMGWNGIKNGCFLTMWRPTAHYR